MRLALLLLSLLVVRAGIAADFDARVAQFDQRLAALRKTHEIHGLSVAIVKDGRIAWQQAYGWAYVDDEVRMTTDTPMWIASVTKPLIATLFLRLAADKKVSLEDRINDVAEWPEFCKWLSGSGLPFGKDLRCSAPITIRNILQHRVNGTPGERFQYNPMMFSRLSRYIEAKFGGNVREVEGRHNRMAHLLEQHILGPAGMRRTMASQWQREKADVFFDLAQGYGVRDGDWVPRVRPERHLAGGAGVVSTVGDLARFDIALDRGTFGDASKSFTPAPYGFGWFVQDYRGERLVWHSGWDEEAGFSALYLKVPQRRLTVILLANGEGLRWGNPLDRAEVESSPFARAFLETFVFEPEATSTR